MLPMGDGKARATAVIGRVAQEFGFRIEEARIGTCAELAEWLAPAAAKLGLTQFADPGELAVNLMGPGVCLTAHLGDRCRSVADIGAGNGALGLTIALLRPEVAVSLLDRRQRVCHFIDLAASRFNLSNCSTVCADMRATDRDSEKYDVVAARAVASGSELLGHLVPLVAAGGRVAAIGTSALRLAPPGLVQEVHQATNVAELWLDIYRLNQDPGGGN